MWRLLLVLVFVLSSSATLAAERVASYRELPYGACRFVADQFHATPDFWQEEALVAFADPKVQRISLQAAAGVGKSAVMSWCAWYFLATQCHGLGLHPKGLVTGITDANLKDNFWAEMARWQGVSPFLSAAFTHGDKRIVANDHPNTWFLGRRAWPKSGNADEQGATLSGLHAAAVASFIDESGAIPPTVARAAEQALADRPLFGKIMQAGNPISLDGMLYDAATKRRHLWHIIVVTNDPDDPRCSSRGDKDWARQQIADYGRDNPWVASYICGKFPPSSINALLGIEDVLAAMQQRYAPDAYAHMQRRLGIDVARFGDDRSVLFPRQGLRAWKPVVMRTADTMQIAARATLAIDKFKPEITFVDDTGHWGHGVIDGLRAGHQKAVGINFAEKAINPRYRNRRTEMWIEMAKAIKGHVDEDGQRSDNLWLPNVPSLVDELIVPTYTFVNGLLALEEKEFIKKRLGRSPDLADGLALTYAIPDMPGDLVSELPQNVQAVARALEQQAVRESGRGGGRVQIDYDPMERD